MRVPGTPSGTHRWPPNVCCSSPRSSRRRPARSSTEAVEAPPGVALDRRLRARHDDPTRCRGDRRRLRPRTRHVAHVPRDWRRPTPRPGIEFALHDATALPLPAAPGRSRLLPAAARPSPRPGRISGAWVGPARGSAAACSSTRWSGSTRAIRCSPRTSGWSLDLVASRGAPMYAGPIVDSLRDGPGWRQRSSRGARRSRHDGRRGPHVRDEPRDLAR